MNKLLTLAVFLLGCVIAFDSSAMEYLDQKFTTCKASDGRLRRLFPGEDKRNEFYCAFDRQNFRLIVKLFEPCAKAGDPQCMKYLIDGVPEWLLTPTSAHGEYDLRYLFYWIRRAYSL